MLDYSQFDPVKALTAADNFLAVSPTNQQAYIIEVAYRKQAAEDPKTDAATKVADLDSAASYAKKGLDVAKQPAPARIRPLPTTKSSSISLLHLLCRHWRRCPEQQG